MAFLDTGPSFVRAEKCNGKEWMKKKPPLPAVSQSKVLTGRREAVATAEDQAVLFLPDKKEHEDSCLHLIMCINLSNV